MNKYLVEYVGGAGRFYVRGVAFQTMASVYPGHPLIVTPVIESDQRGADGNPKLYVLDARCRVWLHGKLLFTGCTTEQLEAAQRDQPSQN